MSGGASDGMTIVIQLQESGKRLHLKTSPRKLNLVAKQIRGLSVTQAITQMKFSPKRAARHVERVCDLVWMSSFRLCFSRGFWTSTCNVAWMQIELVWHAVRHVMRMRVMSKRKPFNRGTSD